MTNKPCIYDIPLHVVRKKLKDNGKAVCAKCGFTISHGRDLYFDGHCLRKKCGKSVVKLYNIWLVEVWNDLGAVYNQPIALSYEPEQWFADLFKHAAGDYATIRKFTTNLKETDARCWRKCEVETGDYNDNECQALSIKNVGFSGNVPVICARPALVSDEWATYTNTEFARFEEADEDNIFLNYLNGPTKGLIITKL